VRLPPCRFGDGEAIYRVAVPDGCLCYPDDREQDLCLHHYHRFAQVNAKPMRLLYCYIAPRPEHAW
jgi:hypothetical protein